MIERFLGDAFGVLSCPRCIDYEVKPILRSDEEKELHVTSSRGSEEAGC